MPERIVIHAGFHKTGTTSIQKTLEANRQLLKPCFSFLLRHQMLGLCEAARAYSKSRTTLDLGMIQYEAVEILEPFAGFDGRLLLCSEDLCGHMPGRHGLDSYAAAPVILEAITKAVRAVFPQAALSFYFGTREKKAWLRSCYIQHLRATRITQSLQDYMTTHDGSADLAAIIEKIRRFAPVTHQALEACRATKYGPLSPLLAHLEVPDDILQRLVLLPPANTAPERQILHRLLELNRSDMPAADVISAKRALLKGGNLSDKGTKHE